LETTGDIIACRFLFQAVAWFLIGVESPHAHTFRIKRGISHSHTFNEDAKVLIVIHNI
jgi:hypothetical protein